MKNLFVTCFCLLSLSAIGQTNIFAKRKKTDNPNSYYARLWNIHQLTRSYNSINSTLNKTIDSIPFRQQHLFEANITPYFTITRGRDDNKVWFRKFEAFIHFNNILRMYRLKDDMKSKLPSLPVWPTNFVGEVGVTYFLNKSPKNENDVVKDFHFVEGIVAHYSNGQNDPHNLKDTVSSLGFPIPNYKTGNFSTNYVKLAYVYGKSYLNNKEYFVSKIYIQKDGEGGSAFEYDDAQNNNYGKWFLGYEFTNTLSTRMFSKPRSYAAYYSFALTYKGRVILDNVDKYKAMHNGSADRFAHTLNLKMQPLNYRNIGFMFEYYQGRDYYNIRFYDYIKIFKLGITANLFYYVPTKAYYKQGII